MTLFLCLTAWLYLQFLPNPVFEGDALTLKCQGWKHTQLSQVMFYKDGKLLNCSKNNQACFIETATVKNSAMDRDVQHTLAHIHHRGYYGSSPR